MVDALFVYGSLMPHLTGAFGAVERARLGAESIVLGPARVAGTLYDLGDYPGLLLARAPHGGAGVGDVHGTLLMVRDPAATFAWLDQFEDINAGAPVDQQIYERVVVSCARTLRQTVSAAGGVPRTDDEASSVEAWVYAMRRVPPGAKYVASGMWHAPSP